MAKSAFLFRAKTILVFLLMALGCLGTAAVHAQLARKPSFYEKQKQNAASPPAQNNFFAPPEVGLPNKDKQTGVSQPEQAESLWLDKRSAKNRLPPLSKENAAPDSLPALKDQSQFDRMARVYDAGTPMEMPHVLFVIDRKAKPVRIFYVQTPRFELHERFVLETGLQAPASRKTINRNYKIADRRFLFGTISWQQHAKSFTYEFWEGDQLTKSLLQQADQEVKASFFGSIRFKANSTLHERRAQEAAISFVTQEALIAQQPYVPLNLGRRIGKIRIVRDANALAQIKPQDIVVLREVPMQLLPVAGVITERPSTALSHVNLLAKNWGIPNAYVHNAAEVFAAYDGQWVAFQASASNYHVRLLSPAEIADFLKSTAFQPTTPKLPVGKPPKPAFNLLETRLLPLAALRLEHRAQCGSKAAHLGALQAARIAGTTVPDGFCIPFAHYAQFMETHRLQERLQQLQKLPHFSSDPQVREKALAALQKDILQWQVDPATSAAWRALWQSQLGSKGVFVRSSSNSEDLPNFSAAGLYATVPNVTNAGDLELAVKKVWASVFNAPAWEARVQAGIAHDAIFMGVFVQLAINSTNAGVMVTCDPFDAQHPYITFISAKRGVGIRVVDGHQQAEQVMYSSWSKAIQRISHSSDKTALQLQPGGGVQEVPLDARQVVLTDALVVRLAHVGQAVKQLFKGVDQDIEWATLGNNIVLLQARPYVSK